MSPSSRSDITTRVAVLLTASKRGHVVLSRASGRLEPTMSDINLVISLPQSVGTPHEFTCTPLDDVSQ